LCVDRVQAAAEALQALAAESEDIRPKIAAAGAIWPLTQMLETGKITGWCRFCDSWSCWSQKSSYVGSLTALVRRMHTVHTVLFAPAQSVVIA